MSNWNASNYRQRKAERLVSVKPEWIRNPETGESFYLRNARSLMSTVLAGYMPSGLTETAVTAWKEKGVEGLDDVGVANLVSSLTPEQIEEANRELKRKSLIIQQCCVIPFLSNQKPEEIEFTEEWKADAIKGLTEQNPEFDASTFDPKDLVLDPRDLDDKDSNWLFRWAAGLVGMVGMKGGEATNVSDLERFRKKTARRSRAGNNRKDIRKAS